MKVKYSVSICTQKVFFTYQRSCNPNLISALIPFINTSKAPKRAHDFPETPYASLKSAKSLSQCKILYYSPFCAAYCLSSVPGGAATKRLSRSSAGADGALAPAEEPAIAFCDPPTAGFEPCVDLPDLAFSILVSRSMESKGFGRPHCTRSGTPFTNARP